MNVNFYPHLSFYLGVYFFVAATGQNTVALTVNIKQVYKVKERLPNGL